MKQIAEPVDYNVLKKHFDAFKAAYGNNDRCCHNANCLIYRCAKGNAEAASKHANEIIRKKGLPLVAVPTTMRTMDSFVIEASRAELSASSVDVLYESSADENILESAVTDIKEYVQNKATETRNRVTELTNSAAGNMAYNKIKSLLKTETL